MSNRNRVLTIVLVLGTVVGSPAALAEEPVEIETDMSKGGITFKSGDNSLTIGARAQFRWTVDDKDQLDADTVGTGLGQEDGTSSAFDVPRVRLILKGGMFKPWLKYQLQFELSRTSGDSSSKVKDAYLDLGKSSLAITRLGQFKAPFSLQQLTSVFNLQFVDRAITDAKFVPGRDMGAMLTGSNAEKEFGYSVGLFNGSGESRVQEDEGHMAVARIWFDPMGEYKLFESANDDPEKATFHIGLAARAGEVQRGTATTGVFEDPNDETAYNVELAFRQRRFAASAEYFRMTDELQNPALGPDLDSDGWYATAGFMVVPKTVELGLRFAQIDPDDNVNQDTVSELRGAFSYYWKGHNLKLQADVGEIQLDSGFAAACGVAIPGLACRNMPLVGTRLVTGQDLKDKQLRVHVQLAF